MTKGGHYQKLSPDSIGPDVCPQHRLVNYTTEIEAKIDAEKIRREAVADTPRTRAEVKPCGNSPHWHIFIPRKGRMRTLRKRARQAKGQEST